MSLLIEDLGGAIPKGTYTVNVVVNGQVRYNSKIVIVK